MRSPDTAIDAVNAEVRAAGATIDRELTEIEGLRVLLEISDRDLARAKQRELALEDELTRRSRAAADMQRERDAAIAEARGMRERVRALEDALAPFATAVPIAPGVEWSARLRDGRWTHGASGLRAGIAPEVWVRAAVAYCGGTEDDVRRLLDLAARAPRREDDAAATVAVPDTATVDRAYEVRAGASGAWTFVRTERFTEIREALTALLVCVDDVREAEADAARERGDDVETPAIWDAWVAMAAAEDRARALIAAARPCDEPPDAGVVVDPSVCACGDPWCHGCEERDDGSSARACGTPGCTGPGPDVADQGPNPEDGIPVACPTCGRGGAVLREESVIRVAWDTPATGEGSKT